MLEGKDQLLLHIDALEVKACNIKQIKKERADLVDSHAVGRIDMGCWRRNRYY